MRESETYTEAAKDSNWCAAMDEEMWARDANDTWDLVDPAQHYKPIGWKWVYKMKYNINGSVNRYKVRLMAKGYAQTHDIDYDETFVVVAKMTTVCVVLADVATRGWHLLRIRVYNDCIHTIPWTV